jgi:hypothetical protein
MASTWFFIKAIRGETTIAVLLNQSRQLITQWFLLLCMITKVFSWFRYILWFLQFLKLAKSQNISLILCVCQFRLNSFFYYMVFCLNLRYLKVQISFTHTNFNHSVLISKENILASQKNYFIGKRIYCQTNWFSWWKNFIEATQNIYNSKGRLIVTGIGCAIIAQNGRNI